jgi:ribonuclease HI
MYKKYQHIHTNEMFFLINDGVYLYKNQDTTNGYVLIESSKYKTQYVLTADELKDSFKYLNEGNQKDILMNVEQEKIEIYSDGCSLTHLEKKPGGWASIVKKKSSKETLMYSGSKLNSDNNYMELQGVVETLKKLDKDYYIEVYSDSKYVVDGINIYLNKRIQNNFKNIKNDELRELWVEYYKAADKNTIQAIWVPSSSMEELEICDKSSKKAAKELKSSEDYNSFFNS